MRALIAVLGILGGVALAASPQGRQIFRSGIDMVGFGVTVVDGKGHYLTDLGPADFEIYEDGQRQAVRLFVPCEAQAGRAPDSARPMAAALHLGALFDISGSMEEDMRFARSAAIRFLGALGDASDYTLVDFDTEVRVARYDPPEFGRLVERIRSRKAEGYTALWDALGVYLDGAQAQDGRKILVLYTDGGDNASSLSFPEVLDLLKASDVTVHAIGFLGHQPTSVQTDLRIALQRLAETTGGQAFFPLSARDLSDVYSKVAADIDAQYTIGYLSSNTGADGAWRKVEVRVVRPGLKGVKVRGRRGYFAPLDATSRRGR